MTEFHPIADIFPMMSGPEFAALLDDIDRNGQLQPIFTYQGKVVDGRNRWRACEKLNLVPDCIEYTGDECDLVEFVVGLNLHRRHLTPSQCGMVAAKLANLDRGGNGSNQHQSNSVNLPNCSAPPISQNAAAEMLNVSTKSVTDAKAVIDKGTPELAAAVDAGEVSVSAAAAVARALEDEPEKQKEIVENGEVKTFAQKVRAAKKNGTINQRGKEFYASFDREEASRRLGRIVHEVSMLSAQHQLDGEFGAVIMKIAELQQYIFPQNNQS